MTDEPNSKIPEFIRSLMPNANEEELMEAAENFREYLTVILRIYERTKRKPADEDSPHLNVRDTLNYPKPDL
jgi:hypothetical protein